MKKIILITGARGVGKTTALAGIVPAKKEEWEKVLVFDTEDSWNDLIERKGNDYQVKGLGLHVGQYVRAYDRFKPTEDLLKAIAKGSLPWVSSKERGALLDYYQWFVDTLDQKLTSGQYRYIFVDTIEPIEAGLSAWAEVNRSKSGWSGNRTFGRLETEAIRPLYENLLDSIGRRGAEFIGLTSHLRQPWVDNKPVLNKVEPGGRLKLLTRIGYLMVWLVHEPKNADGAPAGLVLKARIARMEARDGHLVPHRVLPERVPHFTWTDVEGYLMQPADFANLKPGEVMTPDERALISEMLTDEQMRLMILASEVEARQAIQAGVAPTTDPGMFELNPTAFEAPPLTTLPPPKPKNA